jgi:hypothetical protein
MARLGLTRSAENRHLQDPEDIAKFLKLAEYIRNGELGHCPLMIMFRTVLPFIL